MSGFVRSLSQRLKRSKKTAGATTPQENFEEKIQGPTPIPPTKTVKKKGRFDSLRRAFSHSSLKSKFPTTPTNIEDQQHLLDNDAASIKSYESNKTVLNFKPKTPATNHYAEYYANLEPAVKPKGPRPPTAFDRYPALVAAELAASRNEAAAIDRLRPTTIRKTTPQIKEYSFKSNTAVQITTAPQHEKYASKALPALPNKKPQSQSHDNDDWENAVDQVYGRDEFIEVIDSDLLDTVREQQEAQEHLRVARESILASTGILNRSNSAPAPRRPSRPEDANYF
ncbi:hypothetical protein BDZ45DRAFT_696453 [Acephala macrosclerotiorum]|nr:hypothetical protein BDZ45DRAFT_696453 [Acephala macrosclerotiorum]